MEIRLIKDEIWKKKNPTIPPKTSKFDMKTMYKKKCTQNIREKNIPS